MNIEDILLRGLANPDLVAKGSSLTQNQLDQNFVIIYNELAALSNSEQLDAYDPSRNYIGGSATFVAFDSKIWKFISATSQQGVQPDSDPAIWQRVTAGAIAHERNKDQFIDFGGQYQVSAEDIFNAVNKTTTQLAAVQSIVDGTVAPASPEMNGLAHIIGRFSDILDVNSIAWQGGNTIRYNISTGVGLPSYAVAGNYLCVTDSGKAINDGSFLISGVDTSPGTEWIQITNPNRNNADDDEGVGSPAASQNFSEFAATQIDVSQYRLWWGTL